MTYIVKTIQIATNKNRNEKEGTTHIYYTGKGGYTTRNLADCQRWYGGWSKRHWAKKYIDEREDFSARFGTGYNDAWDIQREIIEIKN